MLPRAPSLLARVNSKSIAPCGSIKFLPIGASLRTCQGADDAAQPGIVYYTELVSVNLYGGIIVGSTNRFGYRQADQIDSASCHFHSAGLVQARRSWPYHCSNGQKQCPVTQAACRIPKR